MVKVIVARKPSQKLFRFEQWKVLFSIREDAADVEYAVRGTLLLIRRLRPGPKPI
jgi:hypothetical protein